jgi:exopolyphosphatase/guanosine-5'-triphosphate,3'-diphosphate pyrophosphatase
VSDPKRGRDSPSRRIAAIDVGTNSIRLIVAEARPDGSYRVLDDEKEVGRLGKGLSRTGELSASAMKASALVIARMKGIAEGYGVTALRAVGTCAVREARNQRQFLRLVKQESGVELEVISSDEEARLAFMSVNHAFDLRPLSAAVVDIGGGSTEVVLSSGGVVEKIYSLPLGAVRLTEQFDLASGNDEQRFEEMCESIRKTIKRHMGKPALRPQLLIGTGGTYTALASVAQLQGSNSDRDGGPVNVRGYEIQRSAINHLLNWLRSMSPKARARVPGLSPERAEIIVAGVAIIDGMMRRLKVNTLRVHDRGIRDGIILGMIRDMFPGAGQAAHGPHDRMEAVRRFAESCSYERAHSDHVAQLAVQAFNQMKEQLPGGPWSKPNSRELLEAAGFLHDVGYYINYAKHHKHSYHLIVHSELPGFTYREIEVIANVARYHRRSGPKKSHATFAKLPPGDQELVTKLAAILRVVDGLDRAHAQIVTSVKVQIKRGTAWFIAQADQEPAVDLWGAARKSGLFLKAFGLEARFDWSGAKLRSASASLLRYALK